MSRDALPAHGLDGWRARPDAVSGPEPVTIDAVYLPLQDRASPSRPLVRFPFGVRDG